MNEAYGIYLARCYDTLNADIDYAAWAAFYRAAFAKYAPDLPVKHICEMACGSGSLSLELAKHGCSVTAFDLSEDMLVIADKKVRDAGVDTVRFTLQDMRFFRVYTKADACICMLDSLNCLSDASGVAETFARAYNALNDGGLFIFDVNSRHKFETVYADNAYILEDEHVLLAWQNFYHPSTKRCDLYLTFFLEGEDGRYDRFDEEMRQRMYPVRTLKKLLAEAGFTTLDIVSDFGFTPGDEDTDDRLFFICRKQIKN